MGISPTMLRKAQELIGKDVGHLTVLELTDQIIQRKAKDYKKLIPLVRIRCNLCNEESIIPMDSLDKATENTCCRKCAAKHLRAIKIKESRHYPNQVIGDIKLLHIIGEWSGVWNTYWRVQCILCGNEFDVLDIYIDDHERHCICKLREQIKPLQERISSLTIDGTYPWILDPNRKQKKNCTSGVTGVYQRGEKWIATIRCQGKRYNLGTFKNFEDAVFARKEAEKQYYLPLIEQHKEKYNAYIEKKNKSES